MFNKQWDSIAGTHGITSSTWAAFEIWIDCRVVFWSSLFWNSIQIWIVWNCWHSPYLYLFLKKDSSRLFISLTVFILWLQILIYYLIIDMENEILKWCEKLNENSNTTKKTSNWVTKENRLIKNYLDNIARSFARNTTHK